MAPSQLAGIGVLLLTVLSPAPCCHVPQDLTAGRELRQVVTHTPRLRILIVEDNQTDADLMVMALKRAGYEPDWHRVDTEEAYLKALDSELDLILSDLEMPVFHGARALELLRSRGLEMPFVVVSGAADEDTCVRLIQSGAADCLSKDNLTNLGRVVQHALDAYQEERKRSPG